MLFIVADSIERRLVYTCEILFRQLLNVPYRIISKEKFFNDRELKNNALNEFLFYGIPPERPAVYVPANGLMAESNLSDKYPETSYINNFLKLFPRQHNYSGPDFDIFSASFFLLTGYYFYLTKELDLHKRYQENTVFLTKNHYFSEPWVQLWAVHLAEFLQQEFPHFKFQLPEFTWKITVDVDHPFAFLHKGIRGIAGIPKDILSLNFDNLYHRLSAFRTHNDPFNTFNLIKENLPPGKAVYFFLLQHLSKFDGHFTVSNRHYRQIIKNMAEDGYEIGIHPSYLTFLSRQAVKIEKELLEEITGVEVQMARQHYLRYRLPQTPRIYLDTDISDDFNAVNYSVPGFRYGIAIPFKWFDLSRNLMTTLTIHPAMIMDVTLKNYLKLNIVESKELIINMIEKVRQYGGCFSMLWHNSSLSEIQGWQGYRQLFMDTIGYLKENS